MRNILKQLLSFTLPILAIIIVPYLIERNIQITNMLVFVLGLLVMILGLSIMAINILSFIRKGKGTLAPWSPTRKLVIRGMYRYVRNPMIIGVLVVLAGETIAILSYKIGIWAVVFFVLNTIHFIVYEEPDLEKKFGDEYREYKRNVPRWIPRLKPYKPDQELNSQ